MSSRASDTTSDYSGSITSSSDEYSDSEDDETPVKHQADTASLLWSSTGSKQAPVILFRPDSAVSHNKKYKGIGEKYRLAYKMVKTESKLVRTILSGYGFHEVHPNSADFNLMWTGAHLKPFALRSLAEFQRVNHFPRSYEITRKDRLYKNIDRLSHTKGMKHFDFVPKSYMMPSEYQEFCAAYVKEKGSWIVKPIASSRGRGIYLINNPNQVPLEDNIMVCKYIHNPMLIDGFKFDIRVYVAVTSYDPLIIYMFEEGLTRFATVKYERNTRHLKNQMMHLTNYSINKKSHDYVRCEDPEVEDYGNKWSMSAMLRYLKQEGIDTALLMARIEAVVVKSIIAAELPIATACHMFVPNRGNCIELYGLDILVDENLKPWILEGNLSPSLACDAPLDLKIKSSVVADFFSLAGFQCIDPINRRQNKKQGDSFRRPYSASKSSTHGGAGGVNKRPASANTKESHSQGGLTAEESKVLRMAKEQYQRRGGFVRIFPTSDSWELYGTFLEYKTSMNQMLAQKLFVGKSGMGSANNGPYSAAIARVRSISTHHMLESRHQVISKHLLQYERKLTTLQSNRKKRPTNPRRKSKKPTPVGIDNRSRRSRQESDEESCDDNEVNETSTKPASSKYRSATTRPSKTETASTSSASNAAKEKTKTDEVSPNKSSNRKKVVPVEKETESTKARPSSAQPVQKTNGAAGDGAVSKKPTHKTYSYMPSNDSSSVVSKVSTSSTVSSSDLEEKQTGKSDERDKSNGSSTSETPGNSSSSTTKKNEKKIVTKYLANQSKIAQGVAKKSSECILDKLKEGANLSKVQARHAFSAYLSRVQHRLMMESDASFQNNNDLVSKQEEQMDLVLRFLKRAAGNLRQPFSVTIPSHRLSINDRKRILAKQLGDFVHIYNKETDSMLSKHYALDIPDSMKTNKNSVINSGEFKNFVTGASETELEEILTTYTHRNKSASVFLGASRPKSGVHRTNGVKKDKSLVYSASHGQYMKAPSSSSSSSVEDLASYQMQSSSNSSISSAMGYHHGPASEESQIAIADALQRLSERQAARKYSAPTQINTLTQHIATVNLSNVPNGQSNGLTHKAASLPDLSNEDSNKASVNGNSRLSNGDLSNTVGQPPHLNGSVKQFAPPGPHKPTPPQEPVSKFTNHSAALAMQSKELQQKSKAKHMAVLAQAHQNETSSNYNSVTKMASPPYMKSQNILNQKSGSLARAYSAGGGPHMLPPTPPAWDSRTNGNGLKKAIGPMRRPSSSYADLNYYNSVKYDSNSGTTKLYDKSIRSRPTSASSQRSHSQTWKR